MKRRASLLYWKVRSWINGLKIEIRYRLTGKRYSITASVGKHLPTKEEKGFASSMTEVIDKEIKKEFELRAVLELQDSVRCRTVYTA